MMERNSSECLLKKLDEEIVLLDGAMGTIIQQHSHGGQDISGIRPAGGLCPGCIKGVRSGFQLAQSPGP